MIVGQSYSRHSTSPAFSHMHAEHSTIIVRARQVAIEGFLKTQGSNKVRLGTLQRRMTLLYPPAQHRSGASAHSDPDLQLLSFCFYCCQEYQSTPGISKQVLFKLQIRPEAIQALNFWIACCMQVRLISALWLGQLAKSGQALLAFLMCSTWSSTSVTSSFSIKKLSTWRQVGAVQLATSRFLDVLFASLTWEFCLPCLRLNHYIGGRSHNDKPVGMSFKQMWKLHNKCGECLTNKYGNNLSVSIAHAVWAVVNLRQETSKGLITHFLVFHEAAVDSWTLKLFFQLEISDNLK